LRRAGSWIIERTSRDGLSLKRIDTLFEGGCRVFRDQRLCLVQANSACLLAELACGGVPRDCERYGDKAKDDPIFKATHNFLSSQLAQPRELPRTDCAFSDYLSNVDAKPFPL